MESEISILSVHRIFSPAAPELDSDQVSPTASKRCATIHKIEEAVKRDYGEIGYYGRPITQLSRSELLAALGELVDMYKESKRKNEKCKELLGAEKFEEL